MEVQRVIHNLMYFHHLHIKYTFKYKIKIKNRKIHTQQNELAAKSGIQNELFEIVTFEWLLGFLNFKGMKNGLLSVSIFLFIVYVVF